MPTAPTQDPKSSTKFALLVLPQSADFDWGARVSLADGSASQVCDWARMIPTPDVEWWLERLGGLTRQDVNRRDARVVSITEPALQPNVIDAQDDRMAARLWLAWKAALLVAARRPFIGTPVVFTGSGDLIDARRGSIGTVQAGTRIRQPFYATTPAYSNASRPEWSARSPNPVYQSDWRAIHGALHALEGANLPLLAMAIECVSNGLARDSLDFAIPDFVRAAETVLAVPRNAGASTWAARALMAVPELACDPFLASGSFGRDPERFLTQLYSHRSDCVHGKVPFLDLQGSDDILVAQYQLAALKVAVGAVKKALFHPSRQALFADRAVLELAWEEKRFP
jgi:hypothetical protein